MIPDLDGYGVIGLVGVLFLLAGVALFSALEVWFDWRAARRKAWRRWRKGGG